MTVWHQLHPALRVAAVAGAFAVALLVGKGAPPFFAAQARVGSAPVAPAQAAATVPGCATCGAGIAPFRMLPSDLASGGVSQHAATKGPFRGSRKDAP